MTVSCGHPPKHTRSYEKGALCSKVHASVLTYGAEPRSYAFPTTPWFEVLAGKLGALIGDQVARRDACGMDGAPQKSTHRFRSWFSEEKRDAHDPP